MSSVRANRLRVLVAAVVVFTTMSMGVAFSFESHPSHMQWQPAAGSGEGLTESVMLFVVGFALAMLAGALRKLMQRSDFSGVTSSVSATGHSRT